MPGKHLKQQGNYANSMGTFKEADLNVVSDALGSLDVSLHEKCCVFAQGGQQRTTPLPVI